MIDKIGNNFQINKISDNFIKINNIENDSKVDLSKEYKDTIEISSEASYSYAQDKNNWVSNGTGGLTPVLKGMVKVGRGDFNKIQSAALTPPLSEHVMESGKDERCRWIVIDGVRYETPLAENEKPKKQKTLIELLNESSKKIEERKEKEKSYEKVEVINLSESKVITYGELPEEAKAMLLNILGNNVLE